MIMDNKEGDNDRGAGEAYRIRSIAPVSAGQKWFAAFARGAGDFKEIASRVEPVVCWALISFPDGSPDETVGQVVCGLAVDEVLNLDEESGFGEFLGYFPKRSLALEASRGAPDSDDAGHVDDDIHLAGPDEEDEED